MIDWTAACQYLSKSDQRLASLIKRFPGERLETRGDCFKTLANSIVGQQISVKAAASIWQRLEAYLPGIAPQQVLASRPEQLRACGLSGRKVEYLQAIAQAFASGQLSSQILTTLNDQAAIDALCALRGVGQWTAEMVLIFHAERSDILPLGDVALVRYAAQVYSWDTADRASIINQLAAHAEQWRPYRTVAVWYLWRALDPEPVAY